MFLDPVPHQSNISPSAATVEDFDQSISQSQRKSHHERCRRETLILFLTLNCRLTPTIIKRVPNDSDQELQVFRSAGLQVCI